MWRARAHRSTLDPSPTLFSLTTKDLSAKPDSDPALVAQSAPTTPSGACTVTRQATLPAYQGIFRASHIYDRPDMRIADAEIELELARATAHRLTAATFLRPGRWRDCAVLLLAAREGWLAPRPPRPLCGTFGCSLPDRHSGLHQVGKLCLPQPNSKLSHARPHTGALATVPAHRFTPPTEPSRVIPSGTPPTTTTHSHATASLLLLRAQPLGQAPASTPTHRLQVLRARGESRLSAGWVAWNITLNTRKL